MLCYHWSTGDSQLCARLLEQKWIRERRFQSGADSLEYGQGNILLPGAVLAHADAKAGAEEQLTRGH